MKTGCVITVIGRQGSGKTPTAKMYAKQSGYADKNIIVYDVRKEYPENYSRVFKYDNFISYFPSIKKSFVIVEEATAVVTAFKEKILTEKMIACEHENNVIMFLFHSAMDAPPYVLRYSRFKIILPTNDDLSLIQRSRPELFSYLQRAKESGKPVTVDSYAMQT